MVTYKCEKIQSALMHLLFGLCAIAFGCVIVSPNFSVKVLSVAGVTALLVFILDLKNFRKNDVFWICLVLFIIGVSDLIWFRMFKTDNSTAINSYRAYLEVGKICLYGAFSIFVLVSKNHLKLGNNKIHIVLAIALQLMIIIYGGYQHLYLETKRVTFSLAQGADATGAAYTIAFISFYTILVIQHTSSKWKELIILGHFFITFLMLIATETRAAILTYPIIFFGLLVVKCYKEKHIPWKGIVVFIITLLAGAFMMKDNLVQRYNDLNRDIVAYDKNNSATSVGARFAMWETGLIAAKGNYFWQSTDERNKKIIAEVEKDKSLRGVYPHIAGHLHNEVVETLSVKGPTGLILYILFIISVAWYALRKVNSIILCAFLVSLIMFGVGGVMFYSKTTPVAWMLTLIMSIVLLEQNKHRDVIK
ncbi:polymerase [Lelliottia sp. F153]|uniref:O-antigen ligase family protein n=1 Tax=unclassified Lelliottia TaxID=2642424 RepID=UPI000C7EE123|nr:MULTISPECIES: O-antigen ligase family protein [unclassified Lelliottia]PLY44756.1 polymerase [Lelliottia sp. F159]PLY49774.1 polymerase [Lelliottia sp. F154]PLY54090.1 polymerase [Lelliottia sp. F153]